MLRLILQLNGGTAGLKEENEQHVFLCAWLDRIPHNSRCAVWSFCKVIAFPRAYNHDSSRERFLTFFEQAGRPQRARGTLLGGDCTLIENLKSSSVGREHWNIEEPRNTEEGTLVYLSRGSKNRVRLKTFRAFKRTRALPGDLLVVGSFPREFAASFSWVSCGRFLRYILDLLVWSLYTWERRLHQSLRQCVRAKVLWPGGFIQAREVSG